MDQTSSSSSLFDFNSQAGVMAILVAIRQSSLSAADKNNLRDLVFLYTNGGGDAGARVALEQKLQAAHISVSTSATNPTNKSSVSAPAPVLPFGTRRPAPVFSAPVASLATVQSQVAEPVVPPTQVVTPPTTAPIPAPTPVSTIAPTPVPVAEEVVSHVAEVVPPTAVLTPVPAVTPEPVVYSDKSNSNYLDRIREIKSAVNGRIGNPVNLVDINNEVGREYMNALLDAMKRLSGGAGQVEPAMQRLELAFTAVELAIEAHEAKAGTAVSAVAEQVLETTTVEPGHEQASEPIPEIVVPITPDPVIPLPAEESHRQTDNVRVLEPAHIPPPSPDDNRWTVNSLPPHPVVNETAPTAPATPAEAYGIAPEPVAVNTNTQPEPVIAPVAPKSNDPLMTSDVDAGLDQLLSDWVLFKKSGLFGTGPKGREHPLYKKVAHLQIPLLLAGRFEGSTQEIKQSITDYMNGWRYEQGIIYEQGEDFEHYLRRVIRQILDLQKKHRPS